MKLCMQPPEIRLGPEFVGGGELVVLPFRGRVLLGGEFVRIRDVPES